MRTRLFVLAAALAILASSWSREVGRARVPTPRATPVETSSTRAWPVQPEPTPWPTTARDPFRFEADESREGEAGPRRTQERPLTASPAAAPSPAAPVRLVGLLRRGGSVRAAIALDGEVTLVKAGDRVGGFAVVAVDEEGLVRLRGADGVELTLTLPEGP